MKILSIETSCDETGAAVVEKKTREDFVRVLSNVTATSLAIHAKTGGIIPENAAREQVKFIIPTIKKALKDAGIALSEIDALAVTFGPGLIGSLLVGVETVKTLSFVFRKPIVPVNHLLAHLFANFIQSKEPGGTDQGPTYPFIGLIVSGGHTDLLFFESIDKFKWPGGTRDDAAGEALDKIGRLLNLPYPAGPEIEQRAAKAGKITVKFKSPIINSEDFDFSFSGLKAEAARFIQKESKGSQLPNLTDRLTNEICFALQKAIFDVLIKKTISAAQKYNCHSILLGGGVSANQTLLETFQLEIKNSKLEVKVFAPAKTYATDNAAMIGAHALLNYEPVDWHKITALPELYFDDAP